jgi:hypothetical protein
MMNEMIEAIRAAVADGATPEQKATGVQACRTVLTALGAEPGKPIALPGVPQQHPLAGITADQALAMLIARLTTIADERDAATAHPANAANAANATNATTVARPQAAPRIAFVNPAAGPAQARRRSR